MDSQLKSLKVVDLKAILAKASVQVSSKANKTDLIAKIISSQQAIDVYKSIYASDELLAPPEDVDWNNEQEPRVTSSIIPSDPVPVPVPPHTIPMTEVNSANNLAKAANNTSATKHASNTESTAIDEDTEIEKRRKRAERFGIPFVETPKSQSARATTRSSPDNITKLESRAARFGAALNSAQKRQGQSGPVDAEEQERRKKRAERFGITPGA